MLEGAEFTGQALDEEQAKQIISEGQALLNLASACPSNSNAGTADNSLLTPGLSAAVHHTAGILYAASSARTSAVVAGSPPAF